MRRGALIVDQVLRNLLMAFPPIARWRARRGRTAEPVAMDVAYLDRYAYQPYAMLVDELGVSGLEDKVVGEIGPGDHIPAALLLFGAGVREYTAFDRFAGDVGGARAKQLYARLAADLAVSHPSLSRRLAARGISAASFPEAHPDLVRLVPAPIEAFSAQTSARFDLLFSFNVVEHVADVGGLARATDRLLAPGGVAIHRVDFGPHDVWCERDSDFEWLAIPDHVWAWMSSRRGAPNRLRFHEVVELLGAGKSRVEARVVERFDEPSLRAALPSLAMRFRAMPLESLLVKTAFVVCRRP